MPTFLLAAVLATLFVCALLPKEIREPTRTTRGWLAKWWRLSGAFFVGFLFAFVVAEGFASEFRADACEEIPDGLLSGEQLERLQAEICPAW
jgi:hypothetical protein